MNSYSFSFSYLSFSLKDPRIGLVNRVGDLSFLQNARIQRSGRFDYLIAWLLFRTDTLYKNRTSCPWNSRKRSSTSIWIYRISTSVTFA